MTELGAETNAQEWCDYSKGNVKYAEGTLSKGLWGDTKNKVVFRQGISLEYDHIRIPLSKGLVCYAVISLSWLFLKTDAIYSHALCWSVIST